MRARNPAILILCAMISACSLRGRFSVVEGGVEAGVEGGMDVATDTLVPLPDAIDDFADVVAEDGSVGVDVRCASDAMACGGRCVDLQSDPMNCGACGAACAAGSGGIGFACVAGRCVGGCDAGAFVGDAAGGRCLRVARPVAPMSGSNVQGSIFEVRYADAPSDISGNRVRLCADAACVTEVPGSSVAITAGSNVATLTVTAAQRAMFTTGYVFWQLVNSQGQSPVWSVRLISDPTPPPAATALSGRRVRAAFGASADFTGDGLDDLVVSGQRSGVRQPFLVTTNAMSSTLTFTELRLPSGYSVAEVIARAGDVNGDGYSDFAIGVEPRDKVFVFLGGVGAVNPTPIVIEKPSTGTSFGSSIAAAGDLDGDGYGDLVIGDENAPNGTNRGEAHVYWGGPQGPSMAVRSAVTTAEAVADGARFGTEVVGACDVDGNGTHDLIVGAPDSATPAVYVYRSVARAFTVERRLRPVNERRFGAAIACLGDIDHDGDHEWVTETRPTSLPPTLVVYSGSDVVGDLSSISRLAATLDIGPEPVGDFMSVYDLVRDTNGLGHLDLAFLGRGAMGVSVNMYFSDRSGGFAPVVSQSLSTPAGSAAVTATVIHDRNGAATLVLGAPALGSMGALGFVGSEGSSGFRQPVAGDFVPLTAMPAGATRVGEVLLR